MSPLEADGQEVNLSVFINVLGDYKRRPLHLWQTHRAEFFVAPYEGATCRRQTQLPGAGLVKGVHPLRDVRRLAAQPARAVLQQAVEGPAQCARGC